MSRVVVFEEVPCAEKAVPVYVGDLIQRADGSCYFYCTGMELSFFQATPGTELEEFKLLRARRVDLKPQPPSYPPLSTTNRCV